MLINLRVPCTVFADDPRVLYSTDGAVRPGARAGPTGTGGGDTMRTTRAGMCLAVALAAAAGCSREPKLVPVTGTVKLDGKPVDGVRVYFLPTDQSAKT